MVGLRFGDVGPRCGHVLGSLIERLLRGDVAARECGDAVELRLQIVQLGLRLGDLGCERGNLFGAHASIDVIARGGRGVERGPRLRHRGGQFERRELGHDVAGADARALLNLDGGELATDLGCYADLGCPHNAGDGHRRLGAQQEIPAEACSDQDDTKHKDSAATHGRAST
jgi:hypothetical protein